jgi:uncharacterized alpha-E superfamily protein
MLSRVADALYWMGRYLERAEHAARVLEVTRAILVDLAEGDPETARIQWHRALTALSVTDASTEKLLFDSTEPTSLVSCVAHARENARQVREVISSETWEHLNQAYWSLEEARGRGLHESQVSQALNGIVSASFQWDGVADGTMSRDEGWLFVKLGKFVERLDGTCRLVSVCAEAPPRAMPSGENVRWLWLLRCLCATEAYRFAHPRRLDRTNVLDFSVFHGDFPRTIRYSAAVTADFAKRLGEAHPNRGRGVDRAFGKLAARLEYTDVAEVEAKGTAQFLKELGTDLAEASSLLQSSYFLR